MMFDLQTVFYGFCAYLAALSISFPSFYIKYGRTVLVLAWGVGAALVIITFMALQIANDLPVYRDDIYGYSKKLVYFLIEDLPVTCMYMCLSVLINEGLRWVCINIDRHKQQTS